MPNFNLNDEELQSVVTFLLGLQEQNVPWPKKSFAQKAAANGHAIQQKVGVRGLVKAGRSLSSLQDVSPAINLTAQRALLVQVYGISGGGRIKRLSVNPSLTLTRS